VTSRPSPVFNKADRVDDRQELQNLILQVRNSVYISAAKKEGISHLMDRIVETIKSLVAEMNLAIPYSRSDLVAQCYEYGRVISVDYQPEAIMVHAEIARSLAGRLSQYAVS
jgi:50S ribosomal subunit-associated GTPase HflX